MALPDSLTVIVLAAGLSQHTRGRNKLLFPFGEGTVLRSTVTAASLAGSRILVVTGYESEAIRRSLVGLDVELVQNNAFRDGMSTSIVAGVEYEPNADAYAIWPGDMPLIKPDTLHRLSSHAVEGTIVVPTYRTRRGHPVVFSKSFRGELLRLTGDVGARILLERHPDATRQIPVADPGILIDIDTRETLESLVDGSSHLPTTRDPISE